GLLSSTRTCYGGRRIVSTRPHIVDKILHTRKDPSTRWEFLTAITYWCMHPSGCRQWRYF
ncbi:hypothetical protein JB92DRAFT_3038272, partial [Gautieria morchelliformis]